MAITEKIYSAVDKSNITYHKIEIKGNRRELVAGKLEKKNKINPNCFMRKTILIPAGVTEILRISPCDIITQLHQT